MTTTTTYQTSHLLTEGKTPRQRFNMLSRACKRAGMQDMDSLEMEDGRTLKRKVLDGDTIIYNDGYIIIECDDYCLYVDYSAKAIEEWELDLTLVSDFKFRP